MAARQIILDTETTGLKPQDGHRIIEIGCVEMIDRRLTGNNFHHYINPERDIEAGAQAVHGITAEFLADKPKFTDILPDLITYLDGAELVIHNAPFDVGFLDHEFKLAKLGKCVIDMCTVVDSLNLARRKHAGQRNSLDALCQRYSIDNSNRTLHGALLDAEILAEVYLAMTGGQVQLFNAEAAQSSQAVKAAPLQRQKETPVIQASSEELAAHKAYMAWLADA